MDTPGTHCSNEGHLLHIWQRKIAFIKSSRKQNVGSCFSLFPFKEQALLVIEEDPAADVQQRGGTE